MRLAISVLTLLLLLALGFAPAESSAPTAGVNARHCVFARFVCSMPLEFFLQLQPPGKQEEAP